MVIFCLFPLFDRCALFLFSALGDEFLFTSVGYFTMCPLVPLFNALTQEFPLQIRSGGPGAAWWLRYNEQWSNYY